MHRCVFVRRMQHVYIVSDACAGALAFILFDGELSRRVKAPAAGIYARPSDY